MVVFHRITQRLKIQTWKTRKSLSCLGERIAAKIIQKEEPISYHIAR